MIFLEPTLLSTMDVALTQMGSISCRFEYCRPLVQDLPPLELVLKYRSGIGSRLTGWIVFEGLRQIPRGQDLP